MAEQKPQKTARSAATPRSNALFSALPKVSAANRDRVVKTYLFSASLGATSIVKDAYTDWRFTVGRTSDRYYWHENNGETAAVGLYLDRTLSNGVQADYLFFTGVIDIGLSTAGAYLYRPASPVPEPAAPLMLMTGLLFVAVFRKSKRQQGNSVAE